MEPTTDQTEGFPPTESEKLERVRDHLVDEVDRREKAVGSAIVKRIESMEMLERVEHTIMVLQKMETGGVITTVETGFIGETVAEVAAAIVNSGQLDTDGLKVTATVGRTP